MLPEANGGGREENSSCWAVTVAASPMGRWHLHFYLPLRRETNSAKRYTPKAGTDRKGTVSCDWEGFPAPGNLRQISLTVKIEYYGRK